MDNDTKFNDNFSENNKEEKVKFFKYNIRVHDEKELKSEADNCIEEFKKIGSIELGGSPIFEAIYLIAYSVLSLLVLGAISFVWMAPLWLWLCILLVLIPSIILEFGCYKKYLLDLKRNKLVEDYKYLFIHKVVDIADSRDIKLLGVSTSVSFEKETDDNNNKIKTVKLKWLEESVLFYGEKNNKIIVDTFETDSFEYLKDIEELHNIVFYAIANYLKCMFIYGDFSSKIVERKDHYNKLEDLIEFVPKEEQLPDVDFKSYDSTYSEEELITPSEIVSFEDRSI